VVVCPCCGCNPRVCGRVHVLNHQQIPPAQRADITITPTPLHPLRCRPRLTYCRVPLDSQPTRRLRKRHMNYGSHRTWTAPWIASLARLDQPSSSSHPRPLPTAVLFPSSLPSHRRPLPTPALHKVSHTLAYSHAQTLVTRDFTCQPIPILFVVWNPPTELSKSVSTHSGAHVRGPFSLDRH
jgi:hypothetical protein